MAKRVVCEGMCNPHRGDVIRVEVSKGSKDWGKFWYCEVAIACDRAQGFQVTEIQDAAKESAQ